MLRDWHLRSALSATLHRVAPPCCPTVCPALRPLSACVHVHLPPLSSPPLPSIHHSLDAPSHPLHPLAPPLHPPPPPPPPTPLHPPTPQPTPRLPPFQVRLSAAAEGRAVVEQEYADALWKHAARAPVQVCACAGVRVRVRVRNAKISNKNHHRPKAKKNPACASASACACACEGPVGNGDSPWPPDLGPCNMCLFPTSKLAC